MEHPHHDFFPELKALNAQFGGQLSVEEEKDLYRQFWDKARILEKSAYSLFEEFKTAITKSEQQHYQHVLSVMDEIESAIKLPYILGPKRGYSIKSSHNQARALAAQAKQKKRLAKKRKK